MSKRIFATDETEILVCEGDIIEMKENGERISTGARAFHHEEFGDWVSIDLMEYQLDEVETRSYLSVNVTPEHAREFALAILRELDREYK